MEQLRTREHKVEDLRDEEQDERLAEVALEGDSRKGHACEVAECVPWEGSGWVPIAIS
jgi:hypothetical protein